MLFPGCVCNSGESSTTLSSVSECPQTDKHQTLTDCQTIVSPRVQRRGEFPAITDWTAPKGTKWLTSYILFVEVDRGSTGSWRHPLLQEQPQRWCWVVLSVCLSSLLHCFIQWKWGKKTAAQANSGRAAVPDQVSSATPKYCAHINLVCWWCGVFVPTGLWLLSKMTSSSLCPCLTLMHLICCPCKTLTKVCIHYIYIYIYHFINVCLNISRVPQKHRGHVPIQCHWRPSLQSWHDADETLRLQTGIGHLLPILVLHTAIKSWISRQWRRKKKRTRLRGDKEMRSGRWVDRDVRYRRSTEAAS